MSAIATCTENTPETAEVDLFEDDEPWICFEIPDSIWAHSEHERFVGIYKVSLMDVLQEYVESYWDHTHGEETPKVIRLLRECADRVETDLSRRLAGRGE